MSIKRPQSSISPALPSSSSIQEKPLIFQKSPALAIFEDELQAEIFNARCHDTGETMTVEKAKVFKEEFLRVNSGKKSDLLNLNGMRLGVNSIIALSNCLQSRNIEVLNLADNTISDYGMNAVKSIINNTSVKHINLSSNMISQSGLEMILDELMKNNTLETLDLGVQEGSIRKNSIEIDGAKCLAAILLHNKHIETLKLQDNDITMAGGEIIGAALKQNRTLKHLKIAENNLKTEGAEFIIRNSFNIESLDLGKNYITSKIGFVLKNFLESSQSIRRINLEYNELFIQGAEMIAAGLKNSNTLISLNLRGNSIRDEGLEHIADALFDNQILEELDISMNEITSNGISILAETLTHTNLKLLNISKNPLTDVSLLQLADNFQKSSSLALQKIDFSSSRIGDNGLLYFLEKIENCQNLKSIKSCDNFISERVEKVLQDVLDSNRNLVELALTGNRLSVCCLNKIKKILIRNKKEIEEKEPDRLKEEIYRLKFEQKKILSAKEKLKQQEKDIGKLEEMKSNLLSDLERLKIQESSKRQGILERIEDYKMIIEKKKNAIKEKNEDFLKLKEKHEIDLKDLQESYKELKEKREKLEEEYLKVEGEIKQQEFESEKIINELNESIKNLKSQIEDIEQKTHLLNEEYRILSKQQENEAKLEEISPNTKQKRGSLMKRKSTMIGKKPN